jgi:hypothetical protein
MTLHFFADGTASAMFLPIAVVMLGPSVKLPHLHQLQGDQTKKK